MNPKIKRTWILFIILLFAGLPGAAAGGETGKGYVARVRLSVVAAEKVSGLISSFMAIDLRKLGDVVITDKDPEWHLAVTGVELHADGKRTGVAISTVIMAPVREAVTKSIITVLEKEGSLPAALQVLKSKQLVEVKTAGCGQMPIPPLENYAGGSLPNLIPSIFNPGGRIFSSRIKIDDVSIDTI